jgi:hypothetical protein
MGLVAVIALGLTGLFSASTVWTTAAATLTLALLLGAVLGAILLRGADRAFSLGFALFGVVYLVLVEWDWVGGPLGHDLTMGLASLAETMIPDPTFATRASALGPVFVPSERLAARQVRVGNCVEISRMALALAFALVGAFLGRFFHNRQRRVLGQDPPAA